MADDGSQPTTTAPDPTTTTPPPSTETVIDPREFEVMQRQLADANAAFAALQPHEERLRWLLEDPNAGTLIDDAREAYRRVQEKSGPKIEPGMQPIYDKVSKLEKFVDDIETRQKAEAERPQREFNDRYNTWSNSRENNRFFERLMADHQLQAHDLRWLAQVAANNNFEPLEEVWKKESWRFVKAASTPPPHSLRAEAGDGTAGGSQAGQGPTMRERIIQLERARLGIAR
jgi:hypothetical protein